MKNPLFALIGATVLAYAGVTAAQPATPGIGTQLTDRTWDVQHCWIGNELRPCDQPEEMLPGDYFQVRREFPGLDFAKFLLVKKADLERYHFRAILEPDPANEHILNAQFIDVDRNGNEIPKRLYLELLKSGGEEVGGACTARLQSLSQSMPEAMRTGACQTDDLVYWRISRILTGSMTVMEPPGEGQGTAGGGQ